MARLPFIGRGIKERQESLRQAALAKERSAERLRDAEQARDEGVRLEATLQYIRRANHFAERFGSAMRGDSGIDS
jgi:hypothetical protein